MSSGKSNRCDLSDSPGMSLRLGAQVPLMLLEVREPYLGQCLWIWLGGGRDGLDVVLLMILWFLILDRAGPKPPHASGSLTNVPPPNPGNVTASPSPYCVLLLTSVRTWTSKDAETFDKVCHGRLV